MRPSLPGGLETEPRLASSTMNAILGSIQHLFASYQAVRFMRSSVTPLHRHLVLLLTIYLASPASAQDTPREPAASGAAILPSNSPAKLTGKERLGRKWMDEQRID